MTDRIVTICVVICFAFSAAGAVTFSESDLILQRSQSFNYNINISPEDLPLAGAVFTITASGDFSLNFASLECLDWGIEGIVQGTGWSTADADQYVLRTADNVWWQRSIAIDSAAFQSITADNQFELTIQTSYDVDPPGGYYPNPYVSWELEYQAVPEPTALLIFSLAGLLLRRTRCS